MALIKCPDCEKMISPFAVACPNCGRPMAKESRRLLGPRVLVAIFGWLGALMVAGSLIAGLFLRGLIKEAIGIAESADLPADIILILCASGMVGIVIILCCFTVDELLTAERRNQIKAQE